MFVRQTNTNDNSKQELITVRQQLESCQSRIQHLESLLHRTTSDRQDQPMIEDETSKDDDDLDSNMIDLTNVPSPSPSSSTTTFSTQQFSSSSSAIDILHSIIQETRSTLDLPLIKKQKVRRLDDDIDEQRQDYLVRPLVTHRENFQRTFNKYGGHTIPFTRRISSTNSFKSKSRLNKSKPTSTRNNHKITTFFA